MFFKSSEMALLKPKIVLIIQTVDTTGQIMSLRHRELDIRAVQFHPESVLTPQGKQMIQNWVAM